jgi:hypothetical protein
MKKYILLIIVLSGGNWVFGEAPQFDIAMANETEPTSVKATHQLETLIDYARSAIHEADSVRIISCFAPCMSVVSPNGQALDLTREEFIEQAIDAYGSFSSFTSHLEFLLSGFVLSHEENEPFFTNEHNRSEASLGTLKITGDHVNFRRSPSLESPVICKLSRGMYNGKFNPEVWDIEDADGITWTSIIIQHDQFGIIKGYMSTSFVQEVDSGKTPLVEVRKTNHKWLIERFSFIGS